MKVSTSVISHLLAAAVHYFGHSFAQEPNYPTLQLSESVPFNFQLLTALGLSITGGADINPVLAAAKNTIPGNRTSFSEEFQQLAYATKAQAEDPEYAYDAVTVRDTWFSASNYFRQSDTYNRGDWDNPLINELWEEQTHAFDQAIAALPVPGERIRIAAPDGNFTIEAIWYGGTKSPNVKLPTLIVGNGFDAAQEDSYHNYVAPALARGYNAITYEGPGQPTVRRNSGVGFIADWERVLSPVVDYILSHKSTSIDDSRLVLVGNSFGGYLAARAAAFEPRLAATVLISGVWDGYSTLVSGLPPQLVAIYDAGNFSHFDETMLTALRIEEFDTGTTWMLEHALWAFATHSPSELFTRGKAFHVADVVQQIDHPVFVGDAEFENYYAGQPKQVADALGEKATWHVFNGTAGYHCQTGAGQELARTIFGWLNRTL